MHCHDKYDCPNLNIACQMYLDNEVEHMYVGTAVARSNLIAEHGTDAAKQKSVEWLAKNMDDVMRCVPTGTNTPDFRRAQESLGIA
jgi:hypothetical protein